MGLVRLQLLDQMLKVPIYTICLFAEEGEAVMERGFFAGWDIVIGTVTLLPFVLATPLFNIAIFTSGALTANIAQSFDIGISYGFECLLGMSEFSSTNALLLGTVGSIL